MTKIKPSFRIFTTWAIASLFAMLPLAHRSLVFAQTPAAPIAGADTKDFEAADALFQQGQYVEAAKAFERFRDQYKGLSPRSADASYRLAICYLRQAKPLADDAVRELRGLVANPKVDPAAKEAQQLLIAKALTIKASDFTGDTPPQKAARSKALGEAVKEYDVFLSTYSKSSDVDSAMYLSAQLLVLMDSFDEAAKRFTDLFQRFPQSPFAWDARMWVGKSWFIAANQQLNPTELGKPRPPKPEETEKAKAYYNSAQPALVEIFTRSGDIALANNAIFFIAQMQFSRANLIEGENAAENKQRDDLLSKSLDAFRAVRSVEDVVLQQEAKVKRYTDAKSLIRPGPNFLAQQTRLDSIIANEQEKVAAFKNEQDMYLTARIAIARIFLMLKKPDESRVLLSYLSGQKELWEAEKKKNAEAATEMEAIVSSLLCLTYVESRNVEKALETYNAFRSAFKGNPVGDNLPLFVANLAVEENKPEKAEEIVNQGMEDYKDWRYATDAARVLTSVALRKNDYAKALQLTDNVLANNPKPDVEAQMIFLRGKILQLQAGEKGDATLADKSIQTYEVLIKKYPSRAEAEDAQFEICQILAGKDPANAVPKIRDYLSKFSLNGKSPNTANNIPVAQFVLGRLLQGMGKNDDAILEYQKVYERYPKSDPAPGAFFKIHDIYTAKKDWVAALKLMDEFIKKYPKQEYLYYAYSNKAELTFAGNHETKLAPDGKPVASDPNAISNIEEGEKILYAYVEHEIREGIKPQRGEDALIKIAERWKSQILKLPVFVTQNNAQKAIWQKAITSITAAMEKQLQTYPQGERLGAGLELLSYAQKIRLQAQQTKIGEVDDYFNSLISKYGGSADVKAKLLAALASIHWEKDQETASAKLKAAFEMVPTPVRRTVDGKEVVFPTFTSGDYDRLLSYYFAKKEFDQISKIIPRIREEYPHTIPGESFASDNAQAVALFWEAKVLGEKKQTAEAGMKYAELREKYAKSPKVQEAEYGEILGQFDQTKQAPEDAVARLTKIVNANHNNDFELPAKALFLVARILESQGNYDDAIDTYIKISNRYSSARKIAGDGLWAGAQLLEKQVNGKIKIMTPEEKKAAKAEAARKSKAADDKKKTETKPDHKAPSQAPAGKK